MRDICLIHPGNAYLPELEAYLRFFEKRCRITVSKQKDFPLRHEVGRVLWCVMGLYPRRYQADFLVHDYRSLSTGRFPRIKNHIKKIVNQKPNLRIFLNENVASEFDFNDGVPHVYIDMGIHSHLCPRMPAQHKGFRYEFCYVGSVSYEREIDRLIQQFVETYPHKTLMLIGAYDPRIKHAFRTAENILFKGRCSLEETYMTVSQCEFGLCYLPNRYPYYFQTPTKLLEYAALGKKIIMNDVVSNIATQKKYDINAHVVRDHELPDSSLLSDIKDNHDFKKERVDWNHVVENSGITNYL